jgi:sodium/hydrogen antiporter
VLLLTFAVVLLLAVLVSALAKRTILSTAVLFLIAGFLLGPDTTGVLDVHADSAVVGTLAELALFAVLFTDGMRVGWADLRSAWRLPGRALGWGLPLTLLITALAAHYVAGLGWPESLLIGAILAPTDPVFASALVGNDKVPARLRHLLNVESGVNDGLALPFVIVFLAVAAGSNNLHLGKLALEVSLGLVLGVVIPVGAILLERTRLFAASTAYEPLNALAIGLLVLAVAQVTHANLFLAAFAGGITVATFGPRQRAAFEHFGEHIAELFKLAALLVFGALISVPFLAEISWTGWLFAAGDLRCPPAGAVDVVPAVRAGPARAGGGDVVRTQGLRVGGVRPARAGVRDRRRQRHLPSGRADHCDFNRVAFLHRRRGRARVRRRGRHPGLARHPAAPDRVASASVIGSTAATPW